MKVGTKISTTKRGHQNKTVDRHTFNRKRPDPTRPVVSARCQGEPWEHQHCTKLDCTCPCHLEE